MIDDFILRGDSGIQQSVVLNGRGPPGADGFPGEKGDQGAIGPRGVKGDPGTFVGLDLIGASDDLADRPASADEGRAWGLTSEGTIRIYVFVDGAWYDAGPITVSDVVASSDVGPIIFNARDRFGLLGDGTTEPIAPLRAALAATAAANAELWFPDGRYVFETVSGYAATITGINTLTLRANRNAELILPDNGLRLEGASATSRITVDGLIISRATQATWGMGRRALESVNGYITYRNNEIRYWTDACWSKNATFYHVHNNTLHTLGEEGVIWRECPGKAVIEKNIIHSWTGDGINGGNAQKDVVIAHNTLRDAVVLGDPTFETLIGTANMTHPLRPYGGVGIACNDEGSWGEVTSVQIIGNKIIRAISGIDLAALRRYTIVGNVIDNVMLNGINLTDAGVTINPDMWNLGECAVTGNVISNIGQKMGASGWPNAQCYGIRVIENASTAALFRRVNIVGNTVLPGIGGSRVHDGMMLDGPVTSQGNLIEEFGTGIFLKNGATSRDTIRNPAIGGTKAADIGSGCVADLTISTSVPILINGDGNVVEVNGIYTGTTYVVGFVAGAEDNVVDATCTTALNSASTISYPTEAERNNNTVTANRLIGDLSFTETSKRLRIRSDSAQLNLAASDVTGAGDFVFGTDPDGAAPGVQARFSRDGGTGDKNYLLFRDNGSAEFPTTPIKPAVYTAATMPAAADYVGCIIEVSDGYKGASCLAISRGSEWRQIPVLGDAPSATNNRGLTLEAFLSTRGSSEAYFRVQRTGDVTDNSHTDFGRPISDGSGGSVFRIVSTPDGSAVIVNAQWTPAGDFRVSGTWDKPFYLGNYALWVNPGTGKLHVKSGAPTSATDGTVVGTQT